MILIFICPFSDSISSPIGSSEAQRGRRSRRASVWPERWPKCFQQGASSFNTEHWAAFFQKMFSFGSYSIIPLAVVWIALAWRSKDDEKPRSSNDEIQQAHPLRKLPIPA